jgi:predicted transcriptional regulator
MATKRPEILTIREFARRAGVPFTTVLYHLQNGTLKKCKRFVVGISSNQLNGYPKSKK